MMPFDDACAEPHHAKADASQDPLGYTPLPEEGAPAHEQRGGRGVYFAVAALLAAGMTSVAAFRGLRQAPPLPAPAAPAVQSPAPVLPAAEEPPPAAAPAEEPAQSAETAELPEWIHEAPAADDELVALAPAPTPAARKPVFRPMENMASLTEAARGGSALRLSHFIRNDYSAISFAGAQEAQAQAAPRAEAPAAAAQEAPQVSPQADGQRRRVRPARILKVGAYTTQSPRIENPFK